MPNVNVNPTATSGAESSDWLSFGDSGGLNFGNYYGGVVGDSPAPSNWVKGVAVAGFALVAFAYLRRKK